MKLNKYVVALTCTFAVAAAHADTNWYVLGSAGFTRSEVSKSDLTKAFKDSGATVNSASVDQTDTGYKIQVGYQLMKNFALEGGYVDLGTAQYKAHLASGTVKTDWEAKGWNLDAVGRVPFTDKFSMLAKFGVIQAKVDASTHGSDVGGSATHIASIFGLGAEYAVMDNLSIRAEAESYNSLGDADKTGKGDIYLFSAGVAYKF